MRGEQSLLKSRHTRERRLESHVKLETDAESQLQLLRARVIQIAGVIGTSAGDVSSPFLDAALLPFRALQSFHEARLAKDTMSDKDVADSLHWLNELVSYKTFLEPVATLRSRNGLPPAITQRAAMRTLRDSLVGTDDVQLPLLMRAIESMACSLACLGVWTSIAVREIRANLDKILQSASFAVLDLHGLSPTLLAVLDAEVRAGVHPGGGVADASAATGLLWLWRFLAMWRTMWAMPRPPTFKRAVDDGYKKHIQSHHPWLVQQAFFVATSVVPDWDECALLLLAFDRDGEKGVLKCAAALGPPVERIEAALRANGLWQ